tara:strand:- start:1991 stop:2212 length:222 start_codon:yes stop_codon:yes gene_type:complete
MTDKKTYGELEEELKFYKSIFVSHFESRVSNLRIKKKDGKKLWVDKVKDFEIFKDLDKDKEVIEWLKPIRCSR